MTSDFALYNQLFPLVEHRVETPDLRQLMTQLRRLDPKGLELVALLIHTHCVQLHASLAPDSDIPYQGTPVNGQHANFDVRQFDPVLQHMLVEFCAHYLNSPPSS